MKAFARRLLRTISIAVVMVFAGVAFAHAPQDRGQLLERVEDLRARALAPGISAGLRDELLVEAMAVRETLMAEHADDPHRPIWLLDQAADTLARLGVRLDDARLVVGVLEAPRHRWTLEQAESAFALAETVGVLIDARFRQQQGTLDAGGTLSDEDRALNRRLAERELAVRRPLLMGRAMALQVAGNGPEADAQRVLRVLEGVRPTAASISGLRDVSMAIAMLAEGDVSRRASADAMLRGVIDAASLDGPALAEAALLRARLAPNAEEAAQAIAEAAKLPPFVDEQGLAVPALQALAVEATARVYAEAGQLERAVAELRALEQRRDLGGSAADWAAIADQRLAALAQRYTDWHGVPLELVLQAARALVQNDEPSADELARKMLEVALAEIRGQAEAAAAADEPYEPPTDQDAARSLLARLYLVSADRADDPGRAEALQARAVELAALLIDRDEAHLTGLLAPSATLVLATPGEGLDHPTRLALLSRAIERLPEHGAVNRWRLGRAALLIRGGSSVEGALNDAREAMRSENAEVRKDAALLAGAAYAALVAELAPDAPASAAVQTLGEALDFVLRYPDATDLDAVALRLRLAEALLERSRSDDLREVIDLLRPLDSNRAWLMTARAYDKLGDRDEAAGAYGVLAERLTVDRDGEAYWETWVRLLELIDAERRDRLAARDEAGARALAQTLRSQLLRLRAQDPEVGGPRYSRRARAIEARLEGDG